MEFTRQLYEEHTSQSKLSKFLPPIEPLPLKRAIQKFLPKQIKIDFVKEFPLDQDYLRKLHCHFEKSVEENPNPQILEGYLRGAYDSLYNLVRESINQIVSRSIQPTRVARNIGISVSRRITQLLSTIMDVIAPFLTGSLAPILDSIRKILSSSIAQICQLSEGVLDKARSIICNILAVSLAGLAIVCPSEYIGTLGRIFLLAFAAIVGFTQSFIACGAATGLLFLLRSMTSKYNINVSVHNNIPIATPHSNVKEDTKTLVLDLVSMSVLMTAGFSGLDLPTDGRSWEAMLKRHSMLHRAFSSWDFAAEKISAIFDRTAHYIFKYLLGREYTSFNYISEVENLYLDVMSLCSLEVNQKIGRDIELSLKIERMYVDYLKLMRIYATNKEISQRLQKIGGPLSDFYRRVTDKNPKAHVMRKEPVCIALCGGTGIGKSYMMNRLQQDLLKITGAFSTERPMENSVYARASEQEFWDGYIGQSIAIYDDFGQRVDSINNPNLEFFEIIRSVNIFSYPLHTAALQDKANTPFTSDFVILTTNLHNFRVESIRSREAFERRIHLNLKVFIKQEVSSAQPVPGRNYAEKKLDVNLLREYQQRNNLPEDDMSHLIFELDGEQFDYDTLVVKISLQYKKHYDAFHKRTMSNLNTAPNRLPPGAFSVDPAWSGYDIAQAQNPIPIDDNSSISDNDSYFSDDSFDLHSENGYFTYEEIAQIGEEDLEMPRYHPSMLRRVPQETVDAFRRELDGYLSPEIQEERLRQAIVYLYEAETAPDPANIDFLELARSRFRVRVTNSPRLINQTDSVFNNFIYRQLLVPIMKFNPRFTRIATQCYEALEELRIYSSSKFFAMNKWRYWFAAALGIGVAGIGIMSMFLPSPLDTKMPKLSFILSVASSLSLPLLTLPLGSTVTITTAMAGVLSIPWQYFMIMSQHAVAHPKFMPGCKECEEHKKTLEQVPDAFEIKSPEEITKLICPPNQNVRAELVLPESSMKTATVKQQINLESANKILIPKEQIVLESANKLLLPKQQVTLEGDVSTESSMKQIVVKPLAKLEGRDDDTHVPLNEMFPEGANYNDDSRKKKRVQMESAQAEGILCAQLEPLKGIIRNNMWVLKLIDGENECTIGIVTVLKGRKVLINYHYLELMCLMRKKSKDPEKVFIKFTQPNMAEGHSMKLQDFVAGGKKVMRGGNKTEFYICQMPKTVQAGRDLTKHMITSREYSSLDKGLPVQLVAFREIRKNSYEGFSVSGKLESKRVTHLRNSADPTILHKYLETVYYELPSLPGDCGCPLLIDSNEFAHKILGFHFAGMSGKGIACPITYEDIKDLLAEEFYVSDPINITLSPQPDFPLPQSSFYVQGNATEKISHPCKTSITESKVHGLFGPPKMLPAVLGAPLNPEGPMLKALKKNAGPVAQIDQIDILEEVKQDYFKTCIAPFTPLPMEQTVLDFHQACMGIEGNDYFPPIKRGKSAGYPYMAKAKKGKEDWFGSGDWDFSSEKCKELRRDIHELIERAKHREIPEAVFVATLKDEKRLVSKVLEKKTRVFSACPQHFLIAFRQYFGGFIAFMGRNKIRNESAIGTNAHGKDWNEIVRHLTPWEEQNISAGDFAEFDGTFQPQIFEAIVDSINNFYQGTKQDDIIRKSLWAALVNPMHLLDKFIFTFSHGQPSGSPITAISNSAYVSHCLRFILWEKLRELEISFKNHVKLLAYGDDSLISLSPFLAQHLTSFDIAQLFKEKLGMKYTTATKGQFTPEDKFQHISEVTFLKRGFSYDESKMHWYAPLDVVSIEEMCNWIKKCPSEDLATIENCESAIQELCHHSEETFENYTRAITKACKDQGLLVHVPNREFVRTQMSVGQSEYMTKGRPFV